MYKGLKRLVAWCTTFALLCTSIPVISLAEDPVVASDSSALSGDDILYELEEMRDSHTKVFRKRNGNHIAYISSSPIHYQDGEIWTDIDNTLVEDASGDVYTNQANDFTVQLPRKMDEQTPVSISKDGYTVSFILLGNPAESKANKNAAQVKRAAIKEEEKQPIAQYAENPNLRSNIEYKGIYEDTDLRFQVKPDGLKEEFIVHKKPRESVTYSYAVSCDGLAPSLQEDGCILFYKEDSRDIQFTMPAPVMYDASKEPVYSDDIEVSLSQKADGEYLLELTPSFSWLTEKDRKYPVTVDPTVTNPVASLNDTYVYSYAPTANYVNSSSLYLYTTGLAAKGIGLIRLYANWLDDGCRIEKVNLYVKPYNVTSGTNIEARVITSDWNENTVTWDTQPEIGAVLDRAELVSDQYVKLDISKIYSEQNGSPTNYGVALQADKTATLYSEESSEDNVQPFIMMEFKNVGGIENGFAQRTFDMGRAGIVYLNDYTGSISLKRTDIGVDGLLAPVSISMAHVPYNRYYYTQSAPYGAMIYLQTNYNMPIRHDGREGRDYEYTLYDANGNIIYFRYAEKDGPTNEIIRYVDTEQIGYTLEANTHSGTVAYFDLYDPEGNNYHYDNQGRLTNISYKGKQGMVNIYYLDSASRYIDYITDGAGRKYKYVYQTIPNASKGWDKLISEIDYYGTGNTILSKVVYTYVSERLYSVYYPGEGTVYYTYDANGYFSTITDVTGRKLRITTTNGKTTKIEEITGSSVTGDVLSISYDYRKTTIQNSKGQKQIEHFDENGKIAYITDEDNDIIELQTDSGQSGLMPMSVKKESHYNYIKNPGFEDSFNRYEYTDFPYIEIDINCTDAHSGNKALFFEIDRGVPLQYIVAQSFLRETNPLQFSAWVKTDNTAEIYLMLESGDKQFESSKICTKNEWQQISVVADFADISTSEPVTASICVYQVGKVIVDDLQVSEVGSYSFNLVRNPCFLEGTTIWDYSSMSPVYVSSDKKNSSLKSGMALRTSGTTSTDHSAFQRIYINDKKGSYYSFGGWASSENALPFEYDREELIENQRTFGIRVIAYNAENNSERETYLLSFNPHIPDMQYASSGFSLPFDCDYVDYSFIYYNQSGTAYFMGGELIKKMDAAESNSNIPGDTEEGDDSPYTEEFNIRDQVTKRTFKNGNEETYQYKSTAPFSQTGSILTGGGQQLQQSFTYTDDGNYMTSITDASGKISEQVIDPQTGLLQKLDDQKYVYDSNGQLTKLHNAYTATVSLDITYNQGQISRIDHRGMSHFFNYTPFGALKSLSYGENSSRYNQFTNIFDPVTHLPIQQTFGNGQTIEYDYTDKGLLNFVKYNNKLAFTIDYSGMGVPYRIRDNLNNRNYLINNDWNEVYNGSYLDYKYRNQDNCSNYSIIGYGDSMVVYDGSEDERFTSMAASGSLYMDKGTSDYFRRITYDELGRKSAVTVNSGSYYTSPFLSTNYTYENTTRVSEETVSLNGRNVYQKNYRYNDDGKIIFMDGTYTEALRYSDRGITYYTNSGPHPGQNFIIEYDYNRVGNMTGYTKTTLDGTVLENHSLSYGNDDWVDQITLADGEAVTYDTAGNTTGIGSMTLIWGDANRLIGISSDGINASYLYDINGNLYKQISGSREITYNWAGDKLVYSHGDDYPLFYRYDENGQVASVNFGGDEYYYVRNQMGDIIMLVDREGNIGVNYVYDVYGNTVSITGSLADSLGERNPFRYRGYFYDEISGYYFLGTRYYNPKWGRFMNADTLIDASDYMGANQYLYCYGDPLNYVDHEGNLPYEFNLPTSYSLEYQHSQKYDRPYTPNWFELSSNSFIEAVSSLNITPQEHQYQTGFEQFTYLLIDTAYAMQYHTAGDYWKAANQVRKDILLIYKIGKFFIAPSLITGGKAAWATIKNVYFQIDNYGSFSIMKGAEMWAGYRWEDKSLDELRNKIIPMLCEINDMYRDSDNISGNFANIYLHFDYNYSQIKIVISDWAGAKTNQDHLGPVNTYIRDIKRFNFDLLCNLLATVSYVYVRNVPGGFMY